jgi:hypothetical protein
MECHALCAGFLEYPALFFSSVLKSLGMPWHHDYIRNQLQMQSVN